MDRASTTETAAESLEKQFKAAKFIFDSRIADDSIMCRIYEAFVGDDWNKHNCLGCNLQDLSEQISRFLRIESEHCSEMQPHHSVSLYMFLLNTLWERMTDILDILGVPEEYRGRHFECMRRVRRWANFFKHPKEFAWIVHHPEYVSEGTSALVDFKSRTPAPLFIDDEFVKSFYACNSAKGLRSKLQQSRENVVVVLPNVATMTSAVCDCIDRFVSMITENPIYQEILDDKSTIADFYDKTCEDRE